MFTRVVMVSSHDLLEDYKLYRSLRQVAKIHNISRMTVSNRLNTLPEFEPYKKEYEQSLLQLIKTNIDSASSLNDLARRCNLSYAITRRICAENGIELKRKIKYRSSVGEIHNFWKIEQDLGYRQLDGTYSIDYRSSDPIFYVKARCGLCEKRYIVNRRNIENHSSTKCHKCSAKYRK